MKGLTLRARERRLTLVAVVLIGCWGLVSWIVQPIWERLHSLQVHVETQTEKFNALHRLLAQGPSTEETYQQLARYLSSESEEQAQASLLNDLEVLSSQSNVRLNLKPRSAKRDERLSRVEIEVEVEGSQAHLLAFLDALLGMPRLIVVERLRMSPTPSSAQLLRAYLVIQQLIPHRQGTE